MSNRVILSHGTALKVARWASPHGVEFECTRSCVVPEAPRHPSDVLAAVEATDMPHRDLAQRLLNEDCVHVLVGKRAGCRVNKRLVSHLCTGTLPRQPFVRIAEDLYAAVPNLALCQKAALEKDAVALLLLLWEACGTYQTSATGFAERYQMTPATTFRSLALFVASNTTVRGARKIARLLRYVSAYAASPREAQLALLLGLPLLYGGYNLGIPQMNWRVEAKGEARSIARRGHFRCDLCWPEARIDVEYQSREMHGGEEKRVNDSRRVNALTEMGWTVVGVTGDELASITATDAIADALRKRLGKRACRVDEALLARRIQLRSRLGLPTRWE